MRVVWTRFALRQLDQIQEYIAQDSRRIAHQVVLDIFQRTQRLLSANPLLGREGRDGRTRELVLSRTNYIVVYRILDQIEVLAVVHTAQNWPDRFKLQ